MNKIIIIFTSIILISGLAAFASIENTINDFATLKKGKYTCPYTRQNRYSKSVSNSCILGIYKTGAIIKTNCPDSNAELLSMINSGKCTFEEDNTQTYSCQYKEGSCSVTINGHTNYMTSCTGKTPNTTIVLQDVKNGKCYKN